MEKAIIFIKEVNKGKYSCNIQFKSSNKTMPLSDFKHSDPMSFNEKEVEVLREKGQIMKIVCEGKEIYNKHSPKGLTKLQKAQRSASIQNHNHSPAIAPYNFIPLNTKVVQAERIPDFDIYHADRFTGYIDLDIESLTPLYIRDTLMDEEIKQRDENDRQRQNDATCSVYANPDFFSPAGRLRIPGSSLRGMIRTMVEITSYGKFGFYNDKRLYYRGLADKSELRIEYQKNMSSFDKNSNKNIYKMSAGYIFKKNLKYFIVPAKNYRQITKDEAKKLIKEIGGKYKEFRFYDVKTGFIVVSGDMNNKKRDWFIEYKDTDQKPIEINRKDIQDYRDDINRNKDVPNLLELSRKGEVPCFYTRYFDNKSIQRVSFGHTGMFRLAYRQTIGDHIPANLKDEQIIDIAGAIFGNEKTFAGRVFFEDAFCSSSKEDALMGERTPNILAGPKPTTFQHYLEQGSNNLENHPKNLAHYNSNTNIRGYKLYWHKGGNEWEQQNQQELREHQSQYTKINPVKEGVMFKGRIRFENLSEIELGALLFAIDLPEGLAHKLGMGKPLGLGSVRITPKLYISDRSSRYSDLSTEWAEPIEESSDIDKFKKAFSDYVIKKLGETANTLWETKRLGELRIMLDFISKPSNNSTRYMKIEAGNNKDNEFKNRNVLPRPSEVR